MDTEKLLRDLFDLQRFEKDPALQTEIDEVLRRYSFRALSEDELEIVAAAGDPYARPLESEDKEPEFG